MSWSCALHLIMFFSRSAIFSFSSDDVTFVLTYLVQMIFRECFIRQPFWYFSIKKRRNVCYHYTSTHCVFWKAIKTFSNCYLFERCDIDDVRCQLYIFADIGVVCLANLHIHCLLPIRKEKYVEKYCKRNNNNLINWLHKEEEYWLSSKLIQIEILPPTI